MKRFLARLWWCRIWRFHMWTSAVEQGKLEQVIDKTKMDPERIVEHFHFCARMWCRRCGTFSYLNENKSQEPITFCEPWYNSTNKKPTTP